MKTYKEYNAQDLASEITNISGLRPRSKIPKQSQRYWTFEALYSWKYIGLGKNQLYMFEGIYYKPLMKATFCDIINKAWRLMEWQNYSTSDGLEMYTQIMHHSMLSEESLQSVNNYTNLLPVLNGHYSKVLCELIEPSPDIYFTFCIQANYNETAECPRFQQFLDEILPEVDSQLKVLAWFCYNLGPAVDLQKIQVWIGRGADGKSTLSEVLDLLMPSMTVHVPLDVMLNSYKNRFVNSEFAFVWSNLASEINPGAMKAEGIGDIKRLSGEYYIRSERKNDEVKKIVNKCKHTIILNETPLASTYADYAFWRRLSIILFLNRIEIKDREGDIMKSIFYEESDGILAKILSMETTMESVLKENAEEAEILWNLNTQSTFVFYSEFCEEGQSEQKQLYDYYCLFCEKFDRKLNSMAKFTSLLKSVGITKTREWSASENTQYYYYSCQLRSERLLELSNTQLIRDIFEMKQGDRHE